MNRRPLNKYFRNFDLEVTNAFPNTCKKNTGNVNATWKIVDDVFYGDSGKSLRADNSAGNSAGSWIYDWNSQLNSGDYEIECKVRMSKTNDNQMRAGIMARATQNAGYVLMMRGGSGEGTLRLASFIGSSETTINTTVILTGGNEYEINTWYNLKLSLVGSAIKGKIWKDGGVEPTWQIEVTNNTIPNTWAGVGFWTFIGGVAGTEYTYYDDVIIRELKVRASA